MTQLNYDLPDRYTTRTFPPYQHRPGITPHPRRDAGGHSYGIPEEQPPPFNPQNWNQTEDYLYGVDLYNHGYFWEAHESWEGLWKTTGRNDRDGRFLQGLIQVSAARLKKEMGVSGGMLKLSTAGLAKLRSVACEADPYCGIALADFIGRLERHFSLDMAAVPHITLDRSQRCDRQ